MARPAEAPPPPKEEAPPDPAGPRRRGQAVVVTVHGLDWARDKWGPLARLVLRAGEEAALRAAHRIITVSRDLERYLEPRAPGRVLHIPNGVSEPPPAPASSPFPQLIPDQFLLFLGRLVPEKKPHVLLDAFARMDPALQLAMAGASAGTGRYVRSLHRRSRHQPRVYWLGRVVGEEKAWLFQNARAFVLPSALEGHPIALLEAITAGLPCVVSSLPEIDEILGGDDRLAWRVRPGSTIDLETQVGNLLSRPGDAEKRARRAKATIDRDYSWDTTARNTRAVYEEALSVARGGGLE